jgi:hypothetical protein
VDQNRIRPLKTSKKIHDQNASGNSDQMETTRKASRLIRNVNQIDTPEPMTPQTVPSVTKTAFFTDIAAKMKKNVTDNELTATSPIETPRMAFSLMSMGPSLPSGFFGSSLMPRLYRERRTVAQNLDVSRIARRLLVIGVPTLETLPPAPLREKGRG